MAADTMVLIEEAVNEISEGNEPGRAFNKLIICVLKKELNLVDIVENLGKYLTSPAPEDRCKGTQILSLVLHRLSSFTLLEQEVDLLVDFFCERLCDHFSVIPYVVSGLLALVSYQSLSKGKEVKIVQALFKELHTQSLLQADRYNIFTIFSILLEKYKNGLQVLAGEFVFGFIQVMDGEKDPRNLLLAFQLVQIIVKHFPIVLFAEDLFEVTSCYFPIDFTPPENDSNAITRDQLILELRHCISSTSLFAPFSFPLLIEKLTSDIIYAKKDALLTIASCANNYDSRSVKEFVPLLWDNIKKEVFSASDRSVELAGFEALKAMVANIAHCKQQTNSGDLNELLTKVINETKEHFKKPEHKLMKTTATLLQSIACAHDLACSQIIDQILPIVLEQFQLHPQISNQKSLMDALLSFLHVAKSFVNQATSKVLLSHKNNLSGLFFSLLLHQSPLHRSSSIAGLVAMVTTALLDDNEIMSFLNHLLNIILNDHEKIVRHEARLAMTYMSSEFPPLVQEHVITKLKTSLSSCEITSDKISSTPHLTHEYIIITLGSLCTSSDNLEHVVPCLVNDLTKWSKIGHERNITNVLDGLQNILEDSLRNSFSNVEYFKDVVFPPCLQLPITNILGENTASFSPDILEKFAKLLRTICSNISEKSATDVVSDMEDIFLDEKIKDFIPLNISSTSEQTQMTIFLTATLCNISKSVTIPRMDELLSKLLTLATKYGHKRTNIETAKCLSGLLNKIPNGTKVMEEVEKCLEALNAILKESQNEEEKWRATIVLIWITKALTMRGHERGPLLLNKLLDLFCDQHVGQTAADGLYIIMSTPEDVLTSTRTANVKMMYKQRIFIEISPSLTQAFHSSEQEYKHRYLCALSHILHWLPKQVLLSEIPMLLPLLVQSLSCDDKNLQLSTLETLYSLTHDVPKIIAKYVTSLVPTFLELAQSARSLKTRCMALKSLGVLTVLSFHVVFPYKNEVTRTLRKCLDDHKRLVRKEAVKCRNEWFLLGVSSE